MLRTYRNFIRGVSLNRVGRTGVVLTTSSFVTFVMLEVARLLGIITNAYVGLITYLLFPALFVVGLVLIPAGWYLFRKQSQKSTLELLNERFRQDDVRGGFFGSPLLQTITIFTLVNVLFMSAASFRMLSFMEEPVFCGTACHSVMNPEWVTYQRSPHARVKCVDCHVGEGVDALISSKLNGTWQMISVTFDLYERPIPTPVHQLRPARETCEKCHWPEKLYGQRLRTTYRYGFDEASTPAYTTLSLKVDAGTGREKAGIHWHIAQEGKVRYASVRDEREQMIWVEVQTPDGSYKRYTNPKVSPRDAGLEGANSGGARTSAQADLERSNSRGTGTSALGRSESLEPRVMDCVDCHNRATHIYEDPERAIDATIRMGSLDRSLPFIKREALAALTVDYPDDQAGLEGIANHLQGFYERNYPEVATSHMDRIDAAVEVLQQIYGRNIHHGMNITWGSYPSHIGHKGDTGCFRCHNTDLVAEDGSTIPHDCTLCHSILADGQDTPFKNLLPAEETERDYAKHRYLQQEFLDSYQQRTGGAPGDEPD